MVTAGPQTHFRGAQVVAFACALAGVWAGMKPTGYGPADVVWSAAGATVAGVVLRAWVRRWLARRWVADAAAVACVVVVTRWNLPGPFGTETAVAWGGLTVAAWLARGRLTWRPPRWSVRVAWALAGVAVALMGWTALRMLSVVSDAKSVAMSGVNDVRAYDVESGAAKLTEARGLLRDFGRIVDGVGGRVMSWTPLVGQQRQYVRHVLTPLQALVDSSVEFANSRPDETLAVKAGAVKVDALRTLEEPLAGLVSASDALVTSAKGARSGWVLPPLTRPLDNLVGKVGEYSGTLRTTLKVVHTLPWLLGGDKERTYFLAVVTPVENRSGGGFPGAFGEIRAKNGRIRVERFANIGTLNYSADPAHRVIKGPDDYLARYEQFGAGDGVKPVQVWFWSNVTASPDHPSVADVMSQLYPQSGGRKIDGVITVDVHALSALLKITGSVRAEGVQQELTSDNLGEYLMRTQYEELNQISNDVRRDRLFNVADVIVKRLAGMNLPGPATWTSALGPEVENGNIRMWFANDDAMGLMHYLGADGAFGEPDSIASVALTNTNGGPNKIDAYLHRTIDHKVNVDAEGNVKSVTTVIMRNDAPSSGYDEYILGNVKGMPRGTNVTILAMYSPMYCSATLDGKDVGVATEQELGWLVHTVGLGVPPKGTSTVVFTCEGTTADMPVGVPKIRGQVVANDDQWTAGVTTPTQGWRWDGALNSNKWRALAPVK